MGVRKDCDAFSEDVKFWAEYRTGIKEFTPWLVGAEKSLNDGLTKPSDLNEVKALHEKVHTFEKTCLKYLKVLSAASDASKKMTTHEEADNEVAALMERYNKVKAVADEWVGKVDTLLKEYLPFPTHSFKATCLAMLLCTRSGLPAPDPLYEASSSSGSFVVDWLSSGR